MSAGNTDTFPDEAFDLSRLAEPSLETRVELAAALAGLEPFASKRSTRTVGLGFSNGEEGLEFMCRQTRTSSPATQPSQTASLTIVVRGDGQQFVLSPGSKLPEVDTSKASQIFGEAAAGLPESEATWLRQLWEQAQLPETDFVPFSVDQLLATAPYPLSERTSFFVNITCNNGTAMLGDWEEANQTYLETHGSSYPLTNLTVTDPGGKQYEYIRRLDGSEQLVVSIDGETVIHEVTVPGEIMEHPTLDTTYALRAEPDIMHRIMTADIARAQAIQSGAAKPTEGSMQDFAKVLREATDAGVRTDHRA